MATEMAKPLVVNNKKKSMRMFALSGKWWTDPYIKCMAIYISF